MVFKKIRRSSIDFEIKNHINNNNPELKEGGFKHEVQL
jgi:hypothetical protein